MDFIDDEDFVTCRTWFVLGMFNEIFDIVDTPENIKKVERYLEGETIADEDIRKGLQTAAMSGDAVPVFCTDATRGIGIAPLLEGLATLLPNPMQRAPITLTKGNETKPLEISANGPGLGLVFKILFKTMEW